MQKIYTVSVSIGRNVGDEPLHAVEWAEFRDRVAGLLGTVYGAATGRGEWIGEDGRIVHEDTYVVTGTTGDLAGLRADLAVLGGFYGQEAVGLIAQEGTDTLVSGVRVRPRIRLGV